MLSQLLKILFLTKRHQNVSLIIFDLIFRHFYEILTKRESHSVTKSDLSDIEEQIQEMENSQRQSRAGFDFGVPGVMFCKIPHKVREMVDTEYVEFLSEMI